jgi:hypothetical protein
MGFGTPTQLFASDSRNRVTARRVATGLPMCTFEALASTTRRPSGFARSAAQGVVRYGRTTSD